MERDRQPSVDLQALQRIMGSSLIWLGAAFLILMALFFYTFRIENVSGEQVGFLLNRITGELEVKGTGSHWFNGLIKEFYVLDRTLQTIEMTEIPSRGDRKGKDDLKVKTVDGSDVYVDLKVQYRIDINKAEDVLRTSGTQDNYKHKWARDYIRSFCRNFLGELTTEEFYDSSKREAKIVRAETEINARLQEFGILIDQITIPQRPHFYKEYEDMIKKKKEADQTVHAEQSKALAAKQKQQTMVVQVTNKLNVAIEEFEGKMSQEIIAANATSEKTRREADAYYEQKTIDAAAQLYSMKKSAEAIIASRTAEADGIMALKKALEGEGGRNMVKLEYARKLKDVKILGKPFTIQSNIERFEHLKGASSTGRE